MFRQWVTGQMYVDPEHFRQHHSPQAVVNVLESLVSERRLFRRLASALEEHIFCHVGPDGRWR
jgi:hypothetical protein